MPSDLDIQADVYLKFKNLDDLQKKMDKIFGNLKIGASTTQKSTTSTNANLNKFSKTVNDATIKLKKFYSANNVASLKIEKYNMQLKRKMNAEMKNASSIEEMHDIHKKYSGELKKATLVGQQFIKGFRNKQMLEAKRSVVAEEQFDRWQVSLKDIFQQRKEDFSKTTFTKDFSSFTKDIKYDLAKIKKSYVTNIKEAIDIPEVIGIDQEAVRDIESIFTKYQKFLESQPEYVGRDEKTQEFTKTLRRDLSDIKADIMAESSKRIEKITADLDKATSKKLVDSLKDIKYELRETQKSYLEKIKNSMDIPVTSTLEKEALDDLNNALIKYTTIYENTPNFTGKQELKETHIKELAKSIDGFKKDIRGATQKQIAKLTPKDEQKGILGLGKGPWDKYMSMFTKVGAILLGIDLSLKFIKWSVDNILNNKFSGYMKGSLQLWDTTANLIFKPFADKLGMFLIPILIKIMKYTSSLDYTDNIVNAVVSIWDIVSSNPTMAYGKIFKSIFSEKGLFESLFGLMGVGDEYSEGRSKVIDPIIDIGEKIHGALKWIWEFSLGIDSGEKITQLTDALWNGLIWVKDKLWDGLKWVGNKAIDLLRYIVGNLKILTADFIDAIVDSSLFETIAGSIYKGLLYIPNTFLEVIAQIADKVPTVMSSLGSGLFSLINTVIDWLPSIAEKAFGTEAGDWVRSKTDKYKVSDEFIASLSEDPAQAIRDLKVSADEMDFSFDSAVSGVKAWTSQLGDSGKVILDYTDTIKNATDAWSDSQTKSAISRIYGSGKREGFTWVSTDSYSGWERTRAVGGRIPSDGVYYLHAGENVQTVNQTKSGGGTTDTINVKISAQGMTSVDNTMANKIANQTVTQLMANQTLRSGVRLNASRG